MAPARMINFIENHISHCNICMADPDLQDEIARITEIILPESKIPKAVRLQQEDSDDDIIEENDDELETDEDTETDEEDEIDIFDPDDEI